MYKKDIILIENVQRPATLGLPSLEDRRDGAVLIQVYKIMHHIDKIDKDKLLHSADTEQRMVIHLNFTKSGHALRLGLTAFQTE